MKRIRYYNTWKWWGVVCLIPMIAIDFDDKAVRLAWIIWQLEIYGQKNN